MTDRGQVRGVARWRKAERERLPAVRAALSAATRAAETAAMIADLERLIPGGPQIVSVYWPIRAEPDLRAWMHSRLPSRTGSRSNRPDGWF